MASYLTNMNQPLGRFVGHSLEIQECMAIMKNSGFGDWGANDFTDTKELTLNLAGAMIYLGKKAKTLEEGYEKAQSLLESGVVFAKFEKMCQLQGGDISKIGVAQKKIVVKAPQSGFISDYDSEKVGIAAIVLGAGRKLSSDRIDLTAGIEVFKKIGDAVTAGQPLFRMHVNSEKGTQDAEALLLKAVTIRSDVTPAPKLIVERFFN